VARLRKEATAGKCILQQVFNIKNAVATAKLAVVASKIALTATKLYLKV
jgi:hypothetical protein